MTETLTKSSAPAATTARPATGARRATAEERRATNKLKPDIGEPPKAQRLKTQKPGLILGTVLVGYFMALLDGSIVNVALPAIHENLHASGAGLQMVAAGYIISYAVLLVTGARLGRILGHEKLFKIGLAGFTLTSLACGMAADTTQLVTFRILQGVSSAVMLPQVLSLIQRYFVGEARAKAMSAWTAVLASGVVVGQVLGGVLVTANLFGWTWRPVFLVNVPIGIALLLASTRSLPSVKPEPAAARSKVDILGVLTLSPTILALVVPLVLGHDQHWPVWGWVLLAATLPMLALFLTVESRVAKRGESPILPKKVLRIPGMKPSLLLIFSVMVVYAGNLFATAIHLQNALGFSALRTGLAFAPAAVAFGFVSYYWRRIPAHLIRRASLTGLLLGVVGIALQVPMFSGGGDGGFWLYADQFLVGLGIGLGNAPTMTNALMKVPVEDAADASGLLATNAQLAQVVGIATLGTVYLTIAPGKLLQSGHAMAVMSLAAAAVTFVAVGFAHHLHRADHRERHAAAGAAAVATAVAPAE